MNFASLNLPERASLDLDKLTERDRSWANYPLGVMAQFIKWG